MLSQQNARLGLHHPLLGWLLMFTLVFSLNCQGMGTSSKTNTQTGSRSDHGCCDPTSEPSQSAPGSSLCCVSAHHLPFDKTVEVGISGMIATLISVSGYSHVGHFVTIVSNKIARNFPPPPTLALRI